MGNVKAGDIADFIGAKLIGEDIPVSGVASINNLKPHTLVFSKKSFCIPTGTKNLVLCTAKFFESDMHSSGSSFIICDNPRLQFAKVVQRFFVEKIVYKIHPTAVIAEDADIHPNVSIGPYCVVESGVTIGEGTVLKNHVVISENVKVGKFCYIKSGAIIGEEGFGFDFEEDKTPVRLPHLGSVEIGDYVEVGSNTTIARGTLDSTLIKSNTKLDDHVHISHNCQLGDKSIVTACAELSGGVILKGSNWIGPNVSIIQKVIIEEGALVGVGSVITDNVGKNKKMMGLSAMGLRDLIGLKRIIKNAK